MESKNEEKVFSCTYCGVNYKYRHTLNNHLLKKHNVNNNKSYLKKIKCKICDKKFTLKKTMMRHLRTLHLEDIVSTPDLDLQFEQNNSDLIHSVSETDTSVKGINEPMNFNLQILLPDGYNYTVIEYTDLEPDQFIAKFYINDFNIDNINTWILALGEKSKITFRTTNVRNSNIPGIIFKKRYRCHHNTRPKKNTNPSKKHYNCKATLGLQIISENSLVSAEFENLEQDEINSKNCINNPTKALVLLKHIHNHDILKADVLKYRIPSEEIKQIFLKLFKEGKSPSSALSTFKSNLQNEKGNSNYKCAGDRGELPNRQWVYYLYYKTFKQQFGELYSDTLNKNKTTNCKETNNDISQDLSACNDFNEAMEQFNHYFKIIKYNFNYNKTYFLPAIKSFIESMETNVKIHADLYSAISTFGKPK